jgi:predicted lactoylglutathione lyase
MKKPNVPSIFWLKISFLCIIFGLLIACTASKQRGAFNTPRLSSHAEKALTRAINAEKGGKKVALLIGNKTYKNIPNLDKPINDASDLAAALESLGFEVVLEKNSTKKAIDKALKAFGVKSKKANVAMFFYAGHGLQVDGENILVPTDYDPAHQQSGLSANTVQKTMQDATNGTKIMVLDACRNNPFIEESPASGRGTASSRAVAKGLAPMVKTDEFYIGYSTAAGEVASDGVGRNSPYTAALLKHIREPIPIEILFKRVRASVKKETNQVQVPAEYSSLTGDFCFTGCGVEISDRSSTCDLKIGQGNYEGECRRGNANGQGVQRYADGEYYTGGFKNNLRHGQGVQYLTDGTEISGRWEKGRISLSQQR